MKLKGSSAPFGLMSDGDCLEQELWFFLPSPFITEIKHISAVSTGYRAVNLGEGLEKNSHSMYGNVQSTKHSISLSYTTVNALYGIYEN